MKTNINLMLQQVEEFIVEYEITASVKNRHNETLYMFPLFSDDEEKFFLITVCFSGDEVIGAISTPMNPEYFLNHMSDEDFSLEYAYIYPICGKGTMWNSMELPLLHLISKAKEIYNDKRGIW